MVTKRQIPLLEGLISPVFSPDGTRIAYSAVLKGGRGTPLYVSPDTGGAPTTLVADGVAPSWSPDGSSIAFMWRTPSRGLVLATLHVGSGQPPVEIPGISEGNPPVWSPSGEWIVCATRAGVALVSPDGKRRRMLPRLNARALGWSKDSKTLYGLHGDNGNWALLAEDVGSGAIREVADYASEISPYGGYNGGLRLSLSADGKSVAIGTEKSQSDLWMLEGFLK